MVCLFGRLSTKPARRVGERPSNFGFDQQGPAGGAIQALSAQGLSGKVAISGQDADLAGIKRIAAGTQTMTVYKPITLLANTAAEIAVELGNGQEPKADTSLNNGLKDVPSRLLTPIDVNKNNIKDTVIKDGFHKESEL